MEINPSQSSERAGVSGRAPSPHKSSSALLRQKIVTIDLPNNGSGFGFSVISDGERGGAIVHSIVEGGIASMVSLCVGWEGGGPVKLKLLSVTLPKTFSAISLVWGRHQDFKVGISQIYIQIYFTINILFKKNVTPP